MKKNQIPFKYVPKLWATLAFFILLGGSFYIFYGRKKTSMRIAYFEEIFTDFYTHVSNFTILLLLYMVIGYLWLLMGVSFSRIIILGMVLIGINFIYELYIPLINTPDIIDAYYGIAGAIPSFIFLYLVKNFGLKLIDTSGEPNDVS